MGIITITGIVDGNLAKGADVNDRVSAILGVINGNIEAANIKNGAVGNPQLATDAVDTINIKAGSVTSDKLASSKATITSNATITPDAQIYMVTALAVPATIAVPSGTPVTAQPLIIRIKDNGTGRALTWAAGYRAIGVTLPTTTVASKMLYVAGRYNLEDAKWDIIGIGREA